MTKPTELPRWGTDQTNETVPSSGLKDSGHPLNSTLVSSYENWLKRVTYEWCAYLNSGNYDGDFHVNGALTVDDDTELQGTLSVDDGIVATPDFTDGFTSSGDATFDANKHVVLSGTGRLKHGEYNLTDLVAMRCVPGSSGVTHNNGATPFISVANGSDSYIHSPPCPSGFRAKKILFTGSGAGGSTAATITLQRLDSDGTLTSVPVTTAVLGSITSAWEYQLTINTPLVIGSGSCLLLKYRPAGAGAIVITITLVYDRV